MDIIGDIASIVTLIVFVIYIIGRISTIIRIKSTLSEEYRFEKNINENELPRALYYDLSDGIGMFFSVSSPNGIKELQIFEAVIGENTVKCCKGDLRHSFFDISPNKKVYVKMNYYDFFEGCFIELKKYDGIKISFGVSVSGADGSLVQTNHKIKMTLSSWIHYLCS